MSNFSRPKRSKQEIEWQRQQAQWFKFCSWSHGIWCNCGDWIFHVKKNSKNIWAITGAGGSDPATIPIVERKGGHVVDGFIVRGGGDGFTAENIDQGDG